MTIDVLNAGDRILIHKKAKKKKKSAADLELILLLGVSLRLDILLQFHIIFEWLSGGRE